MTDPSPQENPAIVAAGGWCAPSGSMMDLMGMNPSWYYDLSSLARKWDKKARKLAKKERRYRKKYRSTARIQALRECAAALRAEADRLAGAWPAGSVNEVPQAIELRLPEIGLMGRGPFRWPELDSSDD